MIAYATLFTEKKQQKRIEAKLGDLDVLYAIKIVLFFFSSGLDTNNS